MRSARSIRFFCLGLRIDDSDDPVFTLAGDLSSVTSGAIFLPGIARFVQDHPQRVGASPSAGRPVHDAVPAATSSGSSGRSDRGLDLVDA